MNGTLAVARRFGPIALVAALLIAAIASGALQHLSLVDLKAHRDELTREVAAHPVLSLGLFFGLYVLIVLSGIPGPSVMTMTSGFLFGLWIGAATSLAACVVGSSLLFLACRSALGDILARRAGPMLQRLDRRFSQNAFSYLLTLRLVPMVPFFVPTVAAAVARTRLLTLVLATLVGTAPSQLILAGLGQGLGQIFELQRPLDLRILASPQVTLPLAGLTLLAIAPVAWRYWRRRRRSD
jgi:uncharacterized membrane protein YdjX (TVP38/TMEM64 family)